MAAGRIPDRPRPPAPSRRPACLWCSPSGSTPDSETSHPDSTAARARGRPGRGLRRRRGGRSRRSRPSTAPELDGAAWTRVERRFDVADGACDDITGGDDPQHHRVRADRLAPRRRRRRRARRAGAELRPPVRADRPGVRARSTPRPTPRPTDRRRPPPRPPRRPRQRPRRRRRARRRRSPRRPCRRPRPTAGRRRRTTAATAAALGPEDGG